MKRRPSPQLVSNAMGICGLNTQRFATVLTHLSTCFSRAEYHYCVNVYFNLRVFIKE